ncbi:MAG: glycosyltransferase family 4 protein, partial [Deltaproteobacteria bacterium]|nr:glycosyltransferase family 4 protein [Deltaproteobacteria bacterium]
QTIIAVSGYTARMVINRYDILPDKIHIIHNAHSFEPQETHQRRRIFKGPLILFLGRVTLQKGPDYFLEVARRVLKAHPEARFVMAGVGDMFKKVLHASAASRLGPRFLFTEFLSRRQVEDLLEATDIFIMPSVSEPFGIVPLEAMARGAVAIISKQSGVAEVLHNAFKVDFWDIDQMAEVVVGLIEDKDRRQALALAGQEEVLRLKWDQAAEKIIDVYRGLS